MEHPVIEFKNVTKRFGEVAAVVENNLAVKPGEFLSILGPSGCGKTTCLRMMAGFEQPSEGEVFIRGDNVTGRSRLQAPGQHGVPALRAVSASLGQPTMSPTACASVSRTVTAEIAKASRSARHGAA